MYVPFLSDRSWSQSGSGRLTRQHHGPFLHSGSAHPCQHAV